jgi:hypothetical protein
MSDEPLTIDGAISALTPEEPKKQPPPRPDNAEPEGGDVEFEEPAEPAEEEPELDFGDAEEEPARKRVPPPASWNADAKAKWDRLPADVQEVVLAREADRDRAVSLKVQETAQLTQMLQGIAQQYQEALPRLADDFSQRWKNVDWLALARDNPDDYIYYRAQMEAEQNELAALAEQGQNVMLQAQQRFLSSESAALAELVPDLVDPVKGTERREKLQRFLIEEGGIAPDALAGATAREISIAYDAMRYREARAAARNAAQARPTTQAAPPPKAVSATTGGPVSPQRTMQGLESKLTKSGSIDDAVALLVARSQQTQRRRQ